MDKETERRIIEMETNPPEWAIKLMLETYELLGIVLELRYSTFYHELNFYCEGHTNGLQFNRKHLEAKIREYKFFNDLYQDNKELLDPYINEYHKGLDFFIKFDIIKLKYECVVYSDINLNDVVIWTRTAKSLGLRFKEYCHTSMICTDGVKDYHFDLIQWNKIKYMSEKELMKARKDYGLQ